ncbi:hypothetical protein SLEP1_g7245 [Rubroshorea leprosula]|uniref:Uncharacterized protein n=1 Tax=Rubroshorea leprosula TaxID=152421 RepID=A0AAV5I8M1_9ROSI|nr:hypothetical protein SLEP1_g7245 [Rubroshorea leprosula]
MEDDLSLIEISGADDSLLQNSADDAPSYLSCSPFHFSRPKPPLPNEIEKLKSNANRESASVDKENVNNTNKSDAAKLSMEPQKMKRKKKGGGYNLRKSLAWNRAFFTEEGFADFSLQISFFFLKLSLLSGNLGEPGGETLSVINEESSSSVLGCASESEDLLVLEKNLFNEVSHLNEEKNNGGGLLTKVDPSTMKTPAKASAVKRNVLSQDANKSGSKRSGCLRPIISSAYPYFANVNMTKAASRESKVSKIPVPKPDSFAISSTSKCVVGANKLKGNNIGQPAVHAQRRLGSGSSKSKKIAQNDAKHGLASRSLTSKASVQQARRNGSMPSGSPLSTDKFTKVNLGKKVIKEPENKPAVHAEISHLTKSSKPSSIPQHGSCVGGSVPVAAQQMVKPSGLRMPSPSLQFFGPSKDSALRTMLPRSTQTSNHPQSDIPSLRRLTSTKPISVKPPLAPMKVLGMVNDTTTIGNDTRSISSAGCSLPSSVSTMSCENRKANLKATNKLKVDLTAACALNSHETTNNQQQLHDTHNDVEKQGKDKGLGNDDNKLFQQNGSLEQVEKDCMKRDNKLSPKREALSGAKLKTPYFMSHHTSGNQLAGNRQYHSSAKNIGISSEGSSNLQDNQESSIIIGDEKSKELVDTVKLCSLEGDHIITEIQRPHVHEGALESGLSEEFHIFSDMNCDNIYPKERGCSAGELGRSDSLLYSADENQVKDSVGSGDYSGSKLHVQVKSFDANVSLENTNDFLNMSAADDQHAESNLLNVKLEMPERADAFRKELETSTACGFDMTEMECPHVDDVAGSTEAQCKCDTDFLNGATSQELERNGKDQIIDAPSLPDIADTNIFQKSCYLSFKELENPHLTSQLSSATQGNSPGVGDAINQEGKESKQGDFPVNIHNSTSDLQPGENITVCHQDNLMLLIPLPCVVYNVNGESNDQAKQMESCSLEANRAYKEGNLIPETYHCPFSVEEKCFDECRKVDTDDIFEVSLNDKNFGEGLKGPHDQFQLEQKEQTNEERAARVNNVTKRLLTGDENLQPFDGSNILHSCNNNLDTSAEKGKSSVVGDTDEQLGENPELQNPGFICNEAPGPVKIKPPDQNLETYFAIKIKHDGQLGCQSPSLEFDLSSPRGAQISKTENDCKALRLNEEPRFRVRTYQTTYGNIVQEAELDSNTLTDAETGVSQEGSSPDTEMQPELNASNPMEAKDETTQCNEPTHDTKQVNLVIKPPPNAVPFSDEWLAAFEAAGEEILTMKSGAVQNSPQDKSLPEPGPWSPVRRKNNQGIGPFDCTKFSNANIPPPESS